MKENIEDLKIANELISEIPISKMTAQLLDERNNIFETLFFEESNIEKSSDFFEKHIGDLKNNPDIESEYEKISFELQELRNKAIGEKKMIYDESGKFQYAIAPNGQKSNLDEFEYIITKTKNFKKWLMTKNSNLLNNNGEILPVFHGSPYLIESFSQQDVSEATSWYGEESQVVHFFDFSEKVERYMYQLENFDKKTIHNIKIAKEKLDRDKGKETYITDDGGIGGENESLLSLKKAESDRKEYESQLLEDQKKERIRKPTKYKLCIRGSYLKDIYNSDEYKEMQKDEKKYGHLEYPKQEFVNLLKKNGYDGYVKNNYVIVFDPKDIKSLSSNIVFGENEKIYN